MSRVRYGHEAHSRPARPSRQSRTVQATAHTKSRAAKIPTGVTSVAVWVRKWR